MQAWHTRTAHCLHEEEGLAKHVHLGGCLSGVCFPASPILFNIYDQVVMDAAEKRRKNAAGEESGEAGIPWHW